jgi:hypothetical protein
MGDGDGIRAKFGIRPRYDDPDNYGPPGSHFGKGRYPPDWEDRRKAVWWRQDYRCARCGRETQTVSHYEVHHIQHLDNGGGNHLSNLAGLCGDCHRLMHPEVEILDGEFERAPLLPAADAQDEVAVIREPTATDDISSELSVDLANLERCGGTAANEYATTSASLATSPAHARRANDSLAELLTRAGIIPRISDYHEITVSPRLRGVRGFLSRYEPTATVETDGDLLETDAWEGGFSKSATVRCSTDTRNVSISVEGGDGGRETSHVAFANPGSRETVEVTVSPPPVSAGTALPYLRDATGYVGRYAVLPSVVISLLLFFFARAVVPVDGTALPLVAMVVGLTVILTSARIIPTMLMEGF